MAATVECLSIDLPAKQRLQKNETSNVIKGAKARDQLVSSELPKRVPMSKELEDEIAGVIETTLQPYLQQFHEQRIEREAGCIEVRVRVREEDPGRTLVLRVNFMHSERQAQIPNIFMPPPMMRGQGIGKRVIAVMHEALKKYSYQLFIVDLVPSCLRQTD